MKRVLAVAVLALVVCSTATAAENNWRFYLRADDGTGMYAASAMTIGVSPNSLDGNYSDQLASDSMDLRFPMAATSSTVKAVEGQFLAWLWNRDLKSPRAPWTDIYSGRKVWDLRVAGLTDASTATPIRLSFLTISSTLLPTASISGKPVKYWLKMVDNRRVEGAPANGTIWSIPIPTPTLFPSIPYFELTLPTLNLTSNTEGTFINEGYKMEFYQTPEPSSLMALGAGLIGLAGCAFRRRRG